MDWDDAVRALGGVPRSTDLLTRYREAHRRYHDLAHVRQVVRDAAALTDGVDRALVVLATIDHEAPPGDHLAAVLLDADLAILASADYERYRLAVRAEYAHVDDDAWRVGRRAVLESLLARSPLYQGEDARHRWEAAARRNVELELRGHLGG